MHPIEQLTEELLALDLPDNEETMSLFADGLRLIAEGRWESHG